MRPDLKRTHEGENMKKKLVITRLGKKDICPFCFKKQKEHSEEYRRWEQIARNSIVFDDRGRML